MVGIWDPDKPGGGNINMEMKKFPEEIVLFKIRVIPAVILKLRPMLGYLLSKCFK